MFLGSGSGSGSNLGFGAWCLGSGVWDFGFWGFGRGVTSTLPVPAGTAGPCPRIDASDACRDARHVSRRGVGRGVVGCGGAGGVVGEGPGPASMRARAFLGRACHACHHAHTSSLSLSLSLFLWHAHSLLRLGRARLVKHARAIPHHARPLGVSRECMPLPGDAAPISSAKKGKRARRSRTPHPRTFT